MGRVIASAVYSKGRKVSDIALEDGYRWACQPDHFVWTGLQEPTPEEMFNLQRQFNLHELAVSDALEKHSRPKLEPLAMPCSSSSIRPSAPIAG